MKKNPEKIASGIDELVEKLKREGVEAAQEQSRQIIHEAETEANRILTEAKTRAAQELDAAKKQLTLEKQAAKDALKIAYRDLVLELKGHLLSRFSEDVERLVGATTQNPDVIKKLVLAAAGRIVDDADIKPESSVEVVLPPQALELEDITRDPQNAGKGPIADFVFSLEGEILREGVTFSVGEDDQNGIKIKLLEERIEVDVTDKAIAQLLLTFLNPRFRAVLDGIIH